MAVAVPSPVMSDVGPRAAICAGALENAASGRDGDG